MPPTPDYTNLTTSWQPDAFLQPPEPKEPKMQALLFNIITVFFAAATLILTGIHILGSRRATIENPDGRDDHSNNGTSNDTSGPIMHMQHSFVNAVSSVEESIEMEEL